MEHGKYIDLICDHCGVQFARNVRSVKNSKNVFCSKECRLNHQRNKVEITCEICGKKFSWRASRLKYYPTKYCSKKCAGVARRNRIKCICKNCGIEFEIKESATLRDYSRGVYCSKECYHEHSRGKNSHMYDHGQTFYPYCEIFNDSLKDRVRKFFGDVCIICKKDVKHNRGKRMDVHHVYVEKMACCETKIEDMNLVRFRFPNEVSQFDSPEFSEEEIMYIRMMVPLCTACHSRVHKLDDPNSKYDDSIYRKMFTEIILNEYDGKCYYTKEEYKKIRKGIIPS